MGGTLTDLVRVASPKFHVHAAYNYDFEVWCNATHSSYQNLPLIWPFALAHNTLFFFLNGNLRFVAGVEL